jgi:hypothetical protein
MPNRTSSIAIFGPPNFWHDNVPNVESLLTHRSLLAALPRLLAGGISRRPKPRPTAHNGAYCIECHCARALTPSLGKCAVVRRAPWSLSRPPPISLPIFSLSYPPKPL